MSLNSSPPVCDYDKFKDEFKFFKRRKPPPDFSKVIDFGDNKDVKVVPVSLSVPGGPHLQGLRPVSQWQAFSHVDTPGFVVIRNPFEPWFQRYWIRRCLRDYPCLPHPCNLDAHQPRNVHKSIWEDALEERDQETASFMKTLLHKLRWVTLGYHHNWDTKEYSADAVDSFPADLASLCRYFAATLGYEDFRAEAAIVNYYHLDSTLAGHTDHSEKDMTAPLFSFSFGCSCIFLLGGPSKDIRPLALYLRSGDIGVMQGPSRLAYHAVPRILPSHGVCDTSTEQGRVKKVPSSSCSASSDTKAGDTISPWTVCPLHKPVIGPHAEALVTSCGCHGYNESEPTELLASPQGHRGDIEQTYCDDVDHKHCQCAEDIGDLAYHDKEHEKIYKCDSEPETGQGQFNAAKYDSETKRMKLNDFRCLCNSSPAGVNDSITCNSSPSPSESFLVPGLLQADVHELCDDKHWEPYDFYLLTSRINMNVRQVLPQGHTSLI